MSRPPKPWILVVLVTSLALNAVFLADHVRRGTFHRQLTKLDLVEAVADKSAYQQAMEARYRQLPGRPEGVVFAGDSLIYQAPWSEFYSDIHNRGIPNETAGLLLGRLGEIMKSRPRIIVLLTGTNDLTQGVPIPQLLRNYRTILSRIRDDCPKSKVVVIGLLPMNPQLTDASGYTNAKVKEANRGLESLTREIMGVRFLDLTAKLADDSGNLRREFTEDGIHLKLEGYLAVREAVQVLLNPSDQASVDLPTAEPR